MSDAIDIAKLYFEVSNRSDMDAIASMMSRSTTYSSANTGVYLGADQIVAMQTAYHRSFKKLHWDVLDVKEVRPGVVLFDFVFHGEKLTGEIVSHAGEEYVIVLDGKIQHVGIRNKK